MKTRRTNSPVLSILSLTFLFVISTAFTAMSQEIRVLENLDSDSLDLVTAISVDDYNTVYMATVVERPYAALVSGKVLLSAFDSSGSLDWEVEMTGDLRVSDIACNDHHVFIAGQAIAASVIDGQNVQAHNMFIAMLNKDGDVQWIQQHDSLEGTFSKLVIEEHSIWASARHQSLNNYLLQVDTLGSVLYRKALLRCLISDLSIDEQGNKYLAGTLFGNRLDVDTISVSTPPYPNFLLKLGANGTAVWAKFTQNVTANHFPRLEVLDDRVFVVQEIRRPTGQVETQLNVYSTDGVRQDTMKLERLGFDPHVQMARTKEAVILQLDLRHTVDTIRHLVLDRDMQVMTEYRVQCKIPGYLNIDYPFALAANGCNFVSSINYIRDSLAVRGEVLYRSNTFGDHALLRVNMGCQLHGTASVQDKLENDRFRLSINPVQSYFQLYADGSLGANLKLHVYDVSGKEIISSLTFVGGEVQVDYSSLASGMYIYSISKDGLIMGSGKIVL